MRVSFDLDDTLFVSPKECPTEKQLLFPLNYIFRDRLRYGTISLFHYLKMHHIEILIYTTSYRSEKYIRSFFRCYGLKIDTIINGKRHAVEVQGNSAEILPSKYPSKYRIDLHVDDDISVLKNGNQYGFRVFLIEKNDSDWKTKLISHIEAIQNLQK